LLTGLFARGRELYSLVSLCGLNNVKHEEVINDTVGKGIMRKSNGCGETKPQSKNTSFQKKAEKFSI
jgi:hypothetical protein